ncbi:protein binding protein [Moniliophthora roreri MCA 2997]|uniref:Protein binding protein n=1 Tax=Moniliophthora roreri (strain MCA 2997) TaxID=1381753 RepID=V2YFI6_MONRO|nr:protein binding protein [Moniliophthora roreri MCA 2997]
MSVYLNPSSSLGFQRPLTVLVKRTLTISNPHDQPVAFKVKTTAPKLYCVRPNSGRIEAGQSAEVAVMLQPLKEEPPLNAKCKDKFLIQSTLITPEKEQKPLAEIWSTQEGGSEDDVVHQQKLKVTYLPPEGQTLVEEDESAPHQREDDNAANQSSIMAFNTVRQQPSVNGHTNGLPDFQPPSQMNANTSHHEDFLAAREESHEEPEHPPPVSVLVQPSTERSPPVDSVPSRTSAAPSVAPPAPPAPVPARVATPPAPAPSAALEGELKEARAEIERLRVLLAAAAPPTELRRRTRRLSDDMTTVPGSDVGTAIDDAPMPQEGVPLQVVVVISLLVFITTYVFF